MLKTVNEVYAALISMIVDMMEKKFTGSLEIHFSQGGIARIIKHETIK